MKKAKYEVRFIERIKNQYFGDGGGGSDDEFVGGDAFFLKDFVSRSKAIAFGKKQSLRKTIEDKIVHEIYIRKEDHKNNNAELMYICEGKITHEDAFEL